MKKMTKKILKIGYYVCLTFLGIITVLLLMSVLPITGNFKLKIVLSGSMEPIIKTGSIVVVKPLSTSSGQADYKIGDIITFQTAINKELITHRIYDIKVVGNEPRYITKGDANNAPDQREIIQREIIGKLLFSLPYLGYVVDFAQKPLGFSLIIILPAIAIVSDEVKKIWKEIIKLKNKKKDNEQDKEIKELKKEVEDLNDEIKKKNEKE